MLRIRNLESDLIKKYERNVSEKMPMATSEASAWIQVKSLLNRNNNTAQKSGHPLENMKQSTLIGHIVIFQKIIFFFWIKLLSIKCLGEPFKFLKRKRKVVAIALTF